MPTAGGTAKVLPNAPQAKADRWDSSHIIPGTPKMSLLVWGGAGRVYFYKLKLFYFSFVGKHFFPCLPPRHCWESSGAVNKFLMRRGKEESGLQEELFVWAEKGIADAKLPLPCGPALHQRRWSTTCCLHSYSNRGVGRPEFGELPVFPL